MPTISLHSPRHIKPFTLCPHTHILPTITRQRRRHDHRRVKQRARAFSTSARLLATHYEILDLLPSASAASIKKQFYKLSKQYHPDMHHGSAEELETAEEKFLDISEAYSVLGDSTKRAKYDRDVIGKGQMSVHGAAAGGTGQSGSGFGGGPAGGRAASGLSRRRGSFTGPPPSFYRSGGWGTNSEKRREHQYKDPHVHNSSTAGQAGPRAAGQAESDEVPFLDPNDVPHFDRAAHYRTNVSVEEQLKQGRRKRRAFDESQEGKSGLGTSFRGGDAADGFKNFLSFGGVLVIAIVVPFFITGSMKG